MFISVDKDEEELQAMCERDVIVAVLRKNMLKYVKRFDEK